jgi:hypothetical protein
MQNEEERETISSGSQEIAPKPLWRRLLFTSIAGRSATAQRGE